MPPRSNKTREEILYEEMLGRPAETRFPDDPDWLYRGGKKEFEERMRELGLLKDEGSPVKIKGQEELFDG